MSGRRQGASQREGGVAVLRRYSVTCRSCYSVFASNSDVATDSSFYRLGGIFVLDQMVGSVVILILYPVSRYGSKTLSVLCSPV
jgi:hypothetical protein